MRTTLGPSQKPTEEDRYDACSVKLLAPDPHLLSPALGTGYAERKSITTSAKSASTICTRGPFHTGCACVASLCSHKRCVIASSVNRAQWRRVRFRWAHTKTTVWMSSV